MQLKSGIAALSAVVLTAAVACTTASQHIARASQAQTRSAAAPSAPAARWDADYRPYVDRTSFTVAFRRLTESQYRHTIADSFGPDLKINARFEPEQREGGLQAIGNARLSITTSGLEQYFAVARSVSDQVMQGDLRDARVGCKPVGEGASDTACATAFIKSRGRQLFRRPLSEAEIAERLAVWKEGAAKSGDFYKGLKLSLVSLLMAPDFLFRTERAEADPSVAGGFRLDGYSRASRLSFVLWDAPPDAELLAAASDGRLLTQAGVDTQVARMTTSPRLADGARAFFSDMLQFDAFDTLTKDFATYPKFSQAVADSAREETLKFLVDFLVQRSQDYRNIFTTHDTIINRSLAAIYKVPYATTDPWLSYTFPEDSERSGVLTQVSFLALFSHPGSSSPTVRGVKLYEIFLCQPTPQPPPDVDFSKVQATQNGTVRSRLLDHMTNPGCSSCHARSDPAGLTLEHFDGLGQTRTLENGAPIDVSAKIGGASFAGARGLGAYLHDNPAAPSCLVQNVHTYGVGRPYDYKDANYIKAQTQTFAAKGYRLVELYRSVLTNPEFFKVVKPEGVTPKTSVASIGAAGSIISTGGGQ